MRTYIATGRLERYNAIFVHAVEARNSAHAWTVALRELKLEEEEVTNGDAKELVL